jgi:DNA-binding NtrC family response regulator
VRVKTVVPLYRSIVTQRTAERETVLVVEDEDHLAELYTEYLEGNYEVRTAYGGLEAMEMLASDLDVVLLDRRMPIVSGNEVLAEIEERGLQCQVAMVTAVDPDFDIIDMGCDDYVVKPVTRDRLTEVVDRLLKLSEYTDRKRELTSKKLKRNVLQVEKTESELADSDTFQRLQREIAEMEETIQGIADDLGDDFVAENR